MPKSTPWLQGRITSSYLIDTGTHSLQKIIDSPVGFKRIIQADANVNIKSSIKARKFPRLQSPASMKVLDSLLGDSVVSFFDTFSGVVQLTVHPNVIMFIGYGCRKALPACPPGLSQSCD